MHNTNKYGVKQVFIIAHRPILWSAILGWFVAVHFEIALKGTCDAGFKFGQSKYLRSSIIIPIGNNLKHHG